MHEGRYRSGLGTSSEEVSLQWRQRRRMGARWGGMPSGSLSILHSPGSRGQEGPMWPAGSVLSRPWRGTRRWTWNVAGTGRGEGRARHEGRQRCVRSQVVFKRLYFIS